MEYRYDSDGFVVKEMEKPAHPNGHHHKNCGIRNDKMNIFVFSFDKFIERSDPMRIYM